MEKISILKECRRKRFLWIKNDLFVFSDNMTLTSLRSRRTRHQQQQQQPNNKSSNSNSTKEENIETIWAPWKCHTPPYSPDKLIIPLPVPHPSHIAVIVYNRDSENPIPIDSESCLELLKRVEETHGILHSVGIGRYRGGGDCPESSYESTVDSQSSNSESPGGNNASGLNTSGEPATPVDEADVTNGNEGEQEKTLTATTAGYQWTLSQWSGNGARKRLPSGTVRVDLASPEDVTLDTDSNQVVFNHYGTTV